MNEPVDELLKLQSAVSGRYTVEGEIGRGGMGIVYRAHDPALERTVAIKLLPPLLAAHGDLRERFLREARTAASLAHPHIVPIHLVEARDDVVFFVMGYVDGETLTSRVRRAGALAPLEVGRIVQEVAWALGYAHGRGVVHRDIKPDNILIEHATARTYVTDFGIARRSDRAALTSEGVVLGTAQFMSPEQAAGEAIDGRTDIYALGVVAYFALTAQLPFDAPTIQATLAMHLTQRPPPIASLRRDLPRPLVEAVDRCLAKQPSDRFQSGEELAEALNALVVPTADIAPLVRNWLRSAEQWMVVAWVLGINGVLLTTMAPSLVGMIALFAVTSLSGFSVDLLLKTRQLLREGYTHEDVRFASLLERQLRERELRSVLGDASAQARRRRTVARSLRFALVGGIAIIALSILRRLAPSLPHLLLQLPAWAAVVAFAMGLSLALINSARVQRSNLLYYSGVWRRGFGRSLFRVAGLGLERRRIGFSTGGTLLAGLPDAGSSADKAVVEEAVALVSRLEGHAAELLSKQHVLDDAVANVRASPELPATAVPAADATRPRADALLARRASGLEQLRAARDGVLEERASLQLAADNIRIQLLRLRTGTATIGDLQHDLSAARLLLQEVSPPDAIRR